ncbi:MAG TPA: hypothetical protein VLA96_09190 [Terriglobales bacterium]|nr:hypothetical protein [Terriglobales bacterium]
MASHKARITTPKKAVANAQNLATAAAAPRCQHIKMSGDSCSAPARSGSNWCVFHAGDYEGSHPVLGVYEDAASIQLEISNTIRQLQLGKLPAPEAGRILYALQVASQNLPRLREEMPSAEQRAKAEAAERELFPKKPQDLWWFLYSRLDPPSDRRDGTQRICRELARFARGEAPLDPALLSLLLPEEERGADAPR